MNHNFIIKVVTHKCLTEACVFIHFNDDHLISIHSQQILALQVLTVSERSSSVIQTHAGMTVAVRRLQMDMFAHAQGVSQASTVRPPLRLTASASLTDVNWTKPAPQTNLWGPFFFYIAPNAVFFYLLFFARENVINLKCHMQMSVTHLKWISLCHVEGYNNH